MASVPPLRGRLGGGWCSLAELICWSLWQSRVTYSFPLGRVGWVWRLGGGWRDWLNSVAEYNSVFFKKPKRSLPYWGQMGNIRAANVPKWGNVLTHVGQRACPKWARTVPKTAQKSLWNETFDTSTRVTCTNKSLTCTNLSLTIRSNLHQPIFNNSD